MADLGWSRLNDAWENYTTGSLPFVKVSKTAGTLFGVLVVALTSGVSDVVETVFNQVILLPISGISSFAVDVVQSFIFGVTNPKGYDGVVYRGPVTAADRLFGQTTTFVSGLGPFGLAAGVAIVLLTSYVALNWREFLGSN